MFTNWNWCYFSTKALLISQWWWWWKGVYSKRKEFAHGSKCFSFKVDSFRQNELPPFGVYKFNLNNLNSKTWCSNYGDLHGKVHICLYPCPNDKTNKMKRLEQKTMIHKWENILKFLMFLISLRTSTVCSVFAVSLKKTWILYYPKSLIGQQGCAGWPDCSQDKHVLRSIFSRWDSNVP